MKLVPFHVEHLMDLEVDLTHNRDGRPLLAEQTPEVVQVVVAEAWSIEHRDRVVACGGRTGGAWWFLCEREALKHPVSLTRIVRGQVRAFAKPGDIAHALDEAACEWLEVLGFARCPEPGDLGVVRYGWGYQ